MISKHYGFSFGVSVKKMGSTRILVTEPKYI